MTDDPPAASASLGAPWIPVLLWLAAVGAAGVLQRAPSRLPEAPLPAPVRGPGGRDPGVTQKDRLVPLMRSFRGEPHRSGYSRHAGPTRGQLRWRFMTRGKVSGQAVLAGADDIFVSSHDGRLYALDGQGVLRWHRELGAPAPGGALVDRDGNLHVGTQAGQLVSFDGHGKQRYRLDLGAPILTAPVQNHTGVVLVAAGRELFALTTSGQERWRFRAHGRVHTSAALDDADNVYFGAQDHRLYALSPAGELRFHYDVGADVDSTPLIAHEGSIVFGSDAGKVHALSPSGRLRWERTLGAPVRAPLGLSPDGRLVALVHGLRPAVHCLTLRSGELLWSKSLGMTDSVDTDARSGALIDGLGRVYLGAHDGLLRAFSRDGETLFEFATGASINSSPSLGPDGTLYVGSDDGWLYALR